MARTKQVPRISGVRGMPPLPAGRRKKAPSPQTPPDKKKKAGRRESPRLAAAPPAKKTVVSKHKKAVKPQLPTKKLSKAAARIVAIEAVVEKDQADNFPSPAGLAAKGSHFQIPDDECICKAWVEVSEDEIKGANRKGEEFWTTVATLANEMMAKLRRPERAKDSIQNRFQKKIQPKALVFKAYYKEAMKTEQSGWNEDNYEKCALELYENDEGTKYPFIECSRILKSIPKYDWEHKGQDDCKEGTIASGGPMGGGMERPMGARAAIAKRNQKRRSDSSLDNTNTESTGAVLSELRLIRQRNEKYTEFNMLLRLGRREEAEAVMERMLAPPQADLVPASVPLVASIPAGNNDVDDTDSSDDDVALDFLNSHYREDVKDVESETEEETGQDDDSGGDPRSREEIAAERARKLAAAIAKV
jgi:hypothetical protein